MVYVNQQDNSGVIDVGFKISEADPCMLYRENKLEICMIIIDVEDMMVIGHKESIIHVRKSGKSFLYKTRNQLDRLPWLWISHVQR